MPPKVYTPVVTKPAADLAPTDRNGIGVWQGDGGLFDGGLAKSAAAPSTFTDDGGTVTRCGDADRNQTHSAWRQRP